MPMVTIMLIKWVLIYIKIYITKCHKKLNVLFIKYMIVMDTCKMEAMFRFLGKGL